VAKLDADLDGRTRDEGFRLVGGESVLEMAERPEPALAVPVPVPDPVAAAAGSCTPLDFDGKAETELSARRPSMTLGSKPQFSRSKHESEGCPLRERKVKGEGKKRASVYLSFALAA
jgi:hypothetical protein